jgi:hypothetical protein
VDVNIFDAARQPLLRSQIKQKNPNDLWGPAELHKVLKALSLAEAELALRSTGEQTFS